MTKYLFYFCGLALLTSCVSVSVLPVVTPDGKLEHVLNCSRPQLNMNSCYQKAGEICGQNGYDILDKNNEVGGFFTPVDKRLVIQCKK
jgi:hypothetical protein